MARRLYKKGDIVQFPELGLFWEVLNNEEAGVTFAIETGGHDIQYVSGDDPDVSLVTANAPSINAPEQVKADALLPTKEEQRVKIWNIFKDMIYQGGKSINIRDKHMFIKDMPVISITLESTDDALQIKFICNKLKGTSNILFRSVCVGTLLDIYHATR